MHFTVLSKQIQHLDVFRYFDVLGIFELAVICHYAKGLTIFELKIANFPHFKERLIWPDIIIMSTEQTQSTLPSSQRYIHTKTYTGCSSKTKEQGREKII